MFNFINDISFKCLLGKQSKNIRTQNGLYLWDVNKKKHFSTSRDLNAVDLPFLQSEMSMHYVSQNNIAFLKNYFKVKPEKNVSVLLDFAKLDYAGSTYKKVRQAINHAAKNDFIIQDNFNKIDDVKDLIEEWSNILADKYFRDHSGKNFYFYSNNFHQDCINVFMYKEEKLVAFATASPNINNTCSYIIGKALCNQYPGLSEYADDLLYKKCIKENIQYINLGQATKGLIHYKMKFPGSFQELHYNGKII